MLIMFSGLAILAMAGLIAYLLRSTKVVGNSDPIKDEVLPPPIKNRTEDYKPVRRQTTPTPTPKSSPVTISSRRNTYEDDLPIITHYSSHYSDCHSSHHDSSSYDSGGSCDSGGCDCGGGCD